ELPRLIDRGAARTLRYAVMEHSEGVALSLVFGRGKVLGADPVRKIVGAIALQLQDMHDHGIVFCNVQAQSVWVARDGSGRVIDLSMMAPADGPLHALLPSNVFALSPEYLRGREYGPASDQFALGALLYELLTHTRPFRGLDTDTIITNIRDKDPLP